MTVSGDPVGGQKWPSLPRPACRKLLDLANGFGARAVAEVENRDDFLAARANLGST